MTVSSRTPEGVPNRCPVCQGMVMVEPSLPFGDAPCPNCGTLLWFVGSNPEKWFYEPFASGLAMQFAERFGVPPEVLRDRDVSEWGIDSLDVVEWVMEMESDFPPQSPG